jgi:hypothetical protein
MLIDPDTATAAFASAATAAHLTEALIRRSIARSHVELVRLAATLPPGTRIVNRHRRGSFLQITTAAGAAPEIAQHGH